MLSFSWQGGGGFGGSYTLSIFRTSEILYLSRILCIVLSFFCHVVLGLEGDSVYGPQAFMLTTREAPLKGGDGVPNLRTST